MSGISRTTTDPDVIRRWTEARGGEPARVRGTERSGAGLLRIHFPDASTDDEDLETIAWDDFFEKFAEKSLAFVYQEATADGHVSRFNKIVAEANANA